MKRGSRIRSDFITLAHGSGGKATQALIDDLLVRSFDNRYLNTLEDQARFDLAALGRCGERLAFTTDSYVVDPLFFPGGDIGALAVNGTINDLAVGGARPLYLSCGLIIEEGLPMEVLRKAVRSMQQAAQTAGVVIVTGDTKVVPRGAADKLFINTSGVGVIARGVNPAAQRAVPGDVILINGAIGEHGAAIADARGDLGLQTTIASDCQPLHGLVETMLAACPDVHCMRDATRGGIATVLNEFARESRCCMWLSEAALPVREEVKGLCELLGLDPLYLANEGKLIAIVPQDHADAVLNAMRSHPAGQDAAIVGEVKKNPRETVVFATHFGGERIVDTLVGEQLPRIC